MNTMMVTVLSYHELDALVNATWDTWKNRFECVAEFEWNNDTEHLIVDVGRTHIEQYKGTRATIEQIDEWSKHRLDDARGWSSGKRPLCNGVHQLMDALFDEGALAAGNYVVKVMW